MGSGLSMASVNKIKELANQREYSLALDIIDSQDLSKSLNPQFLRLCGEIFIRSKRYVDARKTLVMAHRLAPEAKRIIYDLVDLYSKMGYKELVEKYYTIYMHDSDEESIDTKQLLYLYDKYSGKDIEDIRKYIIPYYIDNLDYDWSFQAYLLLKLLDDDDDEELLKGLVEEYFATFKNSDNCKIIESIKDDKSIAVSKFYDFKKETVEDDDASQKEIRREEKKILAVDEERINPNDDFEIIDEEEITSKKFFKRRNRNNDSGDDEAEESKSEEITQEASNEEKNRDEEINNTLDEKKESYSEEDKKPEGDFEEEKKSNFFKRIFSRNKKEDSDKILESKESDDSNKTVKDEKTEAVKAEEATEKAEAVNAEEATEKAEAVKTEEATEKAEAVKTEEATEKVEAVKTEEATEKAEDKKTEEIVEVPTDIIKDEAINNKIDETVETEDSADNIRDEEENMHEPFKPMELNEDFDDEEFDDFSSESDIDDFAAESETIDELHLKELEKEKVENNEYHEEKTEHKNSGVLFEEVDISFDNDEEDSEIDDFSAKPVDEFGYMEEAEEEATYEPEDIKEPEVEEESETEATYEPEDIEEPEVEEESEAEVSYEPEVIEEAEAEEETEAEATYEAEVIEEPEVEEEAEAEEETETEATYEPEVIKEPEVEEEVADESTTKTFEETYEEESPEEIKELFRREKDKIKNENKEKKLDFPVFRSSLFPNYHNDTPEVENNFDEILSGSRSKINENLEKEEQLQRETEQLLASLGINLGSVSVSAGNVPEKTIKKDIVEKKAPSISRDELKNSLRISADKKNILKKMKEYR